MRNFISFKKIIPAKINAINMYYFRMIILQLCVLIIVLLLIFNINTMIKSIALKNALLFNNFESFLFKRKLNLIIMEYVLINVLLVIIIIHS